MKIKPFFIPLSSFTVLLFLFLSFRYAHQLERNREVTIYHEINSVRVLRIVPDTRDTELILPSFLDAINVTPIWARTNGYVAKWLVDIGDQVKEGDLLAFIDTPDVDQEVVQAEGDLGAAIAKENIARITADRGVKLMHHNPEAIAREEVDRMISAHQLALAEIETAKGRLDRFKYLQGFKNLYAPFDGTITERDIDIGSLITSGSNNYAQKIFKIAKSDILRAFINVPQNYFHLIQDGLEAEIRVAQFPKKIFSGRINRNAGSLDPVSRTLLTQINIDNSKHELLPGVYAEIKLKFKSERQSFIVPVEAVVIRSGPPQVALIDRSNIIHMKSVTIGRDFGDKLEIIDGISSGDEIVARVSDRIHDGMKVSRK